MEYKIHFVIEADIEVEAKDWNEAEAEFDLRKKRVHYVSLPGKSNLRNCQHNESGERKC